MQPRTRRRGPRRSRSAGWLAGLVVLVACSDEPAAPAPAPPVAHVAPVAWTSCREDFECATVSVPIDHAAPAGRTIAISLLRAPARRAQDGLRLGSLLVNPGGPGAPMVARLAQTYLTLTVAFPEIADRFDVVAFDWRGVGESAPVQCADGSFFDAARAADLTLQAPGSVEEVTALSRSIAERCQTGADPELLTRLDTDTVARDLDLLRRALGENFLNYLGFSYGSLLGARYATLYPEHVGAFVLDAAVAPQSTLSGKLTARAAAYHDGLDRFFAACAADAKCDLGGGSDAAAVASRFDALVARVRAGGLPVGSRTLGVTDLTLAISDGLRSADWNAFGRDLARAEAGDAKSLLSRADAVTGRAPDGTYASTFLGLLAVGCLEQPFAPGESVATFREAVAAGGPRGEAAFVPFVLCADWPFRRSSPELTIAAPKAPSMLIIGTRHDPIVPYNESLALLAALGNGSHLLSYEGEGHLAAFHSDCVRQQITKFLLDPSSTPAASCPAE